MNIIERSKKVLNELHLFSTDLVSFGEPIKDNRLEELENSIGYSLPEDFKYIMKIHNGITLNGNQILGLDLSFREESLDKVYYFEHNEAGNKIPAYFLPFSPDGRGNHYCLDLSNLDKENLCPVVFWQSDFKYEDMNLVEVCNDSFHDWIKEVMIDWTLEDYDYDGSEK